MKKLNNLEIVIETQKKLQLFAKLHQELFASKFEKFRENGFC